MPAVLLTTECETLFNCKLLRELRVECLRLISEADKDALIPVLLAFGNICGGNIDISSNN